MPPNIPKQIIMFSINNRNGFIPPFGEFLKPFGQFDDVGSVIQDVGEFGDPVFEELEEGVGAEGFLD